MNLKDIAGSMLNETTIQMLLEKAQANPEMLSKVMGRNPQQIQSAIGKAQKLLPNILKNVKDAKSGGKFLSSLGVDDSFIGKQYAKFSPYLSKLPGMNAATASPIIGEITEGMRESTQGDTISSQVGYKKFDKGRYPKIK